MRGADSIDFSHQQLPFGTLYLLKTIACKKRKTNQDAFTPEDGCQGVKYYNIFYDIDTNFSTGTIENRFTYLSSILNPYEHVTWGS